MENPNEKGTRIDKDVLKALGFDQNSPMQNLQSGVSCWETNKSEKQIHPIW